MILVYDLLYILGKLIFAATNSYFLGCKVIHMGVGMFWSILHEKQLVN